MADAPKGTEPQAGEGTVEVQAPQPTATTAVKTSGDIKPIESFDRKDDFLRQFDGPEKDYVYKGRKTDVPHSPTVGLLTHWGEVAIGEVIKLSEKAVEYLKSQGHRFSEPSE